MKPALTVHIMTAALSPGDAIGNYILTLRRLLLEFGCRVQLYADWISPEFPDPAYPSHLYQSSGRDLLWYHYSIAANNLECVVTSADYRIMDFHGVSPAYLFAGYDPHLEQLCQAGAQQLPELRNQFDLCLVHSEYSRQVLIESGYRCVEKVPLVVDSTSELGAEDARLSDLVRRIDYLLFVGRVVPQKDILAQLRILAEIRRHRPATVLIVAGRRDLAPGYQREIDRAIAQLLIADRVLFVEHVKAPALLRSLYRHARFTLITSEWESFCVPVVESMSCGTPVAAHAVPPVPEIMGEGGIVIDKLNPRQAADQIEAAWDDASRFERLRSAAQARAVNFTPDVLRRDLLRVFQRVFA